MSSVLVTLTSLRSHYFTHSLQLLRRANPDLSSKAPIPGTSDSTSAVRIQVEAAKFQGSEGQVEKGVLGEPAPGRFRSLQDCPHTSIKRPQVGCHSKHDRIIDEENKSDEQ